MTADVQPLTPEQCRRAREVLDWTVLDLAEAARVRILPIIRLESGKGVVPPSKAAALRQAFEAAGVEFQADGSVGVQQPAEASP